MPGSVEEEVKEAKVESPAIPNFLETYQSYKSNKTAKEQGMMN